MQGGLRASQRLLTPRHRKPCPSCSEAQRALPCRAVSAHCGAIALAASAAPVYPTEPSPLSTCRLRHAASAPAFPPPTPAACAVQRPPPPHNCQSCPLHAVCSLAFFISPR